MPDPDTDPAKDERSNAVHALETEFSEVMARVRHVVAESAEKLSPGLLPGTYKVFTTIVRCGADVTASALAERMMIDKSQVSRALRELEERGLLERQPDPADRRASRLIPTELGRERLAAARPQQYGRLAQKLSSWPLEDIRELTRLLHAFASD